MMTCRRNQNIKNVHKLKNQIDSIFHHQNCKVFHLKTPTTTTVLNLLRK